MSQVSLPRNSLSRRLSFLVAATLMSSAARAWPQVWGLQPSTSSNDLITGLLLDGSGGTVEVGYSAGSLGGANLGSNDLVAARRNAAGNPIWQKQWGTTADDELFDATADGAGGFFAAGRTAGSLYGPNQGGRDAVLARLDLTGNLLWGVQPGTSAYDEAMAVALDGAGGCYVVGTTEGSLAATYLGERDIWVARYDAGGGLLWKTQLGSSKDDVAKCAAPDGTGGVLVGGSSSGDFGNWFGSMDCFYCRIDSAGNLLWVRQFGTVGFDSVSEILPDGAGGAYLAGWNSGSLSSGPLSGAMVARIDAAGSILWIRNLGSQLDVANAIVPDGSGGVVVGGKFFLQAETSGLLGQPFLARFAADGSPGPTTVIGTNLEDDLLALVWDGATGWTAAGMTQGSLYGTHSGLADAWIARFESCDLDAFTNYCTGGVNSTGKGASISSWGPPYLSANDLALRVQECPPYQLGIFILGDQSNNVPFGNGVLCLGGGIQRLPAVLPTGPVGVATLALDFTDASSPASQITAGSTWYFQFWYRDVAGGGAGFNLSNGLTVSFCP